MIEDLKKRMKLSVAGKIFHTVKEMDDGYLFKDKFNEMKVEVFMPTDIFEKYNVDYDGMRDFIYELLEEYAKSIKGDVLSFDESVEWIEHQVAMNTDEYDVYHGELPATSPFANDTATYALELKWMSEHGVSLGSMIEESRVLDDIDKEKRLCIYGIRGNEERVYIGFAVQWDTIMVPYIDDDLTEREMEIAYAVMTKDIELRDRALNAVEEIAWNMETDLTARTLLYGLPDSPFYLPETLREYLMDNDGEFYVRLEEISRKPKNKKLDTMEAVKKTAATVAKDVSPEMKTAILREYAQDILDELRSRRRGVDAEIESVDESKVVIAIKNESTGEEKRHEVGFEEMISNFAEPWFRIP